MVLPASIVLNSQSQELQAYLVGQIARAAAIFRIDEIIIINDCTSTNEARKMKQKNSDAANFFIANLQYLETPQYLRRTLFPVMPELRFTGLMNPLDAPHHLRQDEPSRYREGVIIKRPAKANKGSWANIGLRKDCQVDLKLAAGTRITVRLDPDPKAEAEAEADIETEAKYHTGVVVSQLEPKETEGKYWGYTVRLANGIAEALHACPYAEGEYDLLIGTSDKGDPYSTTLIPEASTYHHALILFGGLPGIEGLIDGDETLSVQGTDARSLFHYYLNTCSNQGCRTIRTEVRLIHDL